MRRTRANTYMSGITLRGYGEGGDRDEFELMRGHDYYAGEMR